MKEQWKDIPGYEGLYQVSDCGNVRSLDRLVRYKNGALHPLVGRVLACNDDGNGYKIVSLCKNGSQKSFRLHQLVMTAFVGECPEDMEVLHGDETRDNNNLSNLRYGTRQENIEERNHARGENTGTVKLTSEQVNEIHWVWSFGFTLKEIGEYYGVHLASIHNIVTNKTWRHLNYA